MLSTGSEDHPQGALPERKRDISLVGSEEGEQRHKHQHTDQWNSLTGDGKGPGHSGSASMSGREGKAFSAQFQQRLGAQNLEDSQGLSSQERGSQELRSQELNSRGAREDSSAEMWGPLRRLLQTRDAPVHRRRLQEQIRAGHEGASGAEDSREAGEGKGGVQGRGPSRLLQQQAGEDPQAPVQRRRLEEQSREGSEGVGEGIEGETGEGGAQGRGLHVHKRRRPTFHVQTHSSRAPSACWSCWEKRFFYPVRTPASIPKAQAKAPPRPKQEQHRCWCCYNPLVPCYDPLSTATTP